MRAALALLGRPSRPARPPHRRARRHAGTRRRRAPRCTRTWPTPSSRNDIDLVFCCWPADAGAVGGSSPGRRGGYAEASAALEPQVSGRTPPGDAIMVKGSLGSRMGPIVKALDKPLSPDARCGVGARLTRMLYWLSAFSDTISPLNVLPLHHVPHRRRDDHGAGLRVPVRPDDHRPSAAARRAKASRSAPTGRNRISSPRRGTPTMGGLMILFGIVVSTLLWANPQQSLCLDRARRDARLRRRSASTTTISR